VLRLQALERLGWLAVERGDFDTGASTAKEALRLAEELGSQFVASAQALLGYTALQQGQHGVAARLFAESLRSYQANGDLTGAAQVLAWFWRTVAPAYEALGEAAVNGAPRGARMPLDAALSYAASDDD
jgi:tetratricopeptide (TPR) repeat protein